MISVVIPLYNKEKQIAKTLETVFAQTYTDYEIVIVNDGSTDRSAEIVREIHDERIRLIDQENGGVSAARNRGIEEAKGEYIAFLDADDEWKPEYLETQMGLVEKYPECSVFAVNYEFHNEDNVITHPKFNHVRIEETDGIIDNYFEIVCSSNPIITSISVMFRKNVFENIGGFPVGATLGEDLLTWAKCACNYKIAFSKNIEAIYNFRTQKQLVTPRRAPDGEDIVGKEFKKLYLESPRPFMSEYIALWHKMRMTTFVRLNMKKEAKQEYKTIKTYVKPDKKVLFWHYLNFLPGKLIHFILLQISKIKK